MPKNYLIAPSILSANLACLGEEVKNVLDAGADVIHFDVMDNHYVPNLTFGPAVCKSLRDYGITASIDVHLMVEPVDDLIVKFAEVGASMISFHPQASKHVDRSINLIKNNNCQVGVALNPADSLEGLKYILDKLDFVLIMSVNPGFGGQHFIENSLKKIDELQQIIEKSKLNVKIAVDGGVNTNNIASLAKAGASVFIAGSAIYGASDYKAAIAQMRSQLARV